MINLTLIKLEASSASTVPPELAFTASQECSSNPGRFWLGITKIKTFFFFVFLKLFSIVCILRCALQSNSNTDMSGLATPACQ